MVIPGVSPETITGALKAFDRKYRDTPEWLGWERKGTQRYAIVYQGKLYPPKMVISLATGMLRSKFSGGKQSNNYLTKRGYIIIDSWKDNVAAALAASISERAMEKSDQNLNSRKVQDALLAEDKGATSLTRELYSFQLKRPRYNYLTASSLLPKNGIYFFFEKGEVFGDGLERIVRVGTHRADNRFRGRIRQHYGSRNALTGNKNASVFRKHLGGALLRKEDPLDFRLVEWLRQGGQRYPEVEVRVSEYLRANFTYCCFDVAGMVERLLLEKGIIAQLAKHPLGRPSEGWLGKHASDEKIRHSGLWNTQQLDAKPLDYQQLEYLRRIAIVNS